MSPNHQLFHLAPNPPRKDDDVSMAPPPGGVPRDDHSVRSFAVETPGWNWVGPREECSARLPEPRQEAQGSVLWLCLLMLPQRSDHEGLADPDAMDRLEMFHDEGKRGILVLPTGPDLDGRARVAASQKDPAPDLASAGAISSSPERAGCGRPHDAVRLPVRAAVLAAGRVITSSFHRVGSIGRPESSWSRRSRSRVRPR